MIRLIYPQWYVDADDRGFRRNNLARNARAAKVFAGKIPADLARAPRLVAVFEKEGLHGVVALVHYLVSREGAAVAFATFGSSDSFYLGSNDGSVTPLEALEKLLLLLPGMSPQTRARIDTECGRFARIVSGHLRDRNGRRRGFLDAREMRARTGQFSRRTIN